DDWRFLQAELREPAAAANQCAVLPLGGGGAGGWVSRLQEMQAGDCCAGRTLGEGSRTFGSECGPGGSAGGVGTRGWVKPVHSAATLQAGDGGESAAVS